MSTQRSNSFNLSSSSVTPHRRYDVFLNFRGKDVRDNFLEYLFRALRQRGILTFKDDDGKHLEDGETIEDGLFEAIQESRFSIVVLSKNYADSRWCLRELVHILQCKRDHGQVVYPVFYHVKPSEVRKQKAAFGKGFARALSKASSESEVKRWTGALEEVGNLKGWDYPDAKFENEAELIDKLVSKIFNKSINTYQFPNEDLVGMRSRMMQVIELLDLGSNKTRVVGLWGMGGIGKTTLAKVAYDSISWQFEGCSFVDRVTEVLNNGGVLALQEHLISDILGEENFRVQNTMRGISIIQNRVCRKKVLIVLDDVSTPKQVEDLVGKLQWFGHGSRIIITTRDEHVLTVCRAENIFHVQELDKDKATQLFKSKAFAEIGEIGEFQQLIGRALQFAKGSPLALEVLGSTLLGGTVSEWGSILDRLEESLDDKLQEILRISYERLHWKDKEIFLDICCFFSGEKKDRAIKILDSCGFNAVAGIRVLVKKSLLAISMDNTLCLHDLIKKMGWSIVDEKSRKEPGERSRLWHPHDVKHVLMENTGTEKVEGICLLYPDYVQLRPDTFAKMPNLRILSIQCDGCSIGLPNKLRYILWIFMICGAYCFIYLPHYFMWILMICVVCFSDIPNKLHYLQWVHRIRSAFHSVYLPNKLRCLDWDEYPLKCMPSTFQPEHLVELCLTNSCIEHLWHKTMVLSKLSVIDLTNSTSLTKSPEFTSFPNLEDLILEGCSALVDLHPSIKNLKKLKTLNLKGCSSLQTLPYGIESQCLEILTFSGCLKLSNILENFRDLKRLWYLDLDGTGITELPQAIGNSTNLLYLTCSDCIKLESVPSSIGQLKKLQRLLLNGCSSLTKVPKEVGLIDRLETLAIADSLVRELPASIFERLRNLQELSFNGCIETPHSTSQMPFKSPSFSGFKFLTRLDLINCRLKSFPTSICSCFSLKKLYIERSDFESLPASIKDLSNLEKLWLMHCKSLQELPELPPNVAGVLVLECDSLKTLCSLTAYRDAIVIWFAGCHKLVGNEEISILLGYKFLSNQIKENKHRSLRGYAGPGSKIPEWLSYQNIGGSVTFHVPILDLSTSNLLGFALSAVVATKHQDCIIGVKIRIRGKIFNLGGSWFFPSESENVIILYYPMEFFKADELIHTSGIVFEVYFITVKDLSDIGFYTVDPALKPAPEVMECGAHLIYEEEICSSREIDEPLT